MVDYPPLVLLASLLLLWLATRVGGAIQGRREAPGDTGGEYYGLIVGATLTLLSLIIGFSFSMAVTRYDQRIGYEAQEANAIGTEYLRAELLPTADAARVRALLRAYLDQRILFYSVRDRQRLQQINTRTEQLQHQMWAAVRDASATQLSPTVALAVSGMNEVLDLQGFAQAASWNRLPAGAWVLMAAISACGCLLVGYGARHRSTAPFLLLIVPLVVSVSLFLIADIDSPRGGVIRIAPQNLQSLVEALQSP
jgi:hypothetical protein